MYVYMYTLCILFVHTSLRHDYVKRFLEGMDGNQLIVGPIVDALMPCKWSLLSSV